MALTLALIWDQLVIKDPKLMDPNHTVEFTSANLKKLLAQVYKQGAGSSPKSSLQDKLFGGIFK